MQAKEGRLKLLIQEVKLLKNRFIGPTAAYALLIANSEEREKECEFIDEKITLWMKTYDEALKLVQLDRADNESEDDLL